MPSKRQLGLASTVLAAGLAAGQAPLSTAYNPTTQPARVYHMDRVDLERITAGADCPLGGPLGDPLNDVYNSTADGGFVKPAGYGNLTGGAGSVDDTVWVASGIDSTGANGVVHLYDGEVKLATAYPGTQKVSGIAKTPTGYIFGNGTNLHLGNVVDLGGGFYDWHDDPDIPLISVSGLSSDIVNVSTAFRQNSDKNIPELGYAVFVLTNQGVYRLTKLSPTGGNTTQILQYSGTNLKILEMKDSTYCYDMLLESSDIYA